MREEHPIDKRFQALHDAEAMPPEAVHEALSAHMGWSSHAPRTGLLKPVLWAASALILIGAGLFLWITNVREPKAQIATEPSGSVIPSADGTDEEAVATATPEHFNGVTKKTTLSVDTLPAFIANVSNTERASPTTTSGEDPGAREHIRYGTARRTAGTRPKASSHRDQPLDRSMEGSAHTMEAGADDQRAGSDLVNRAVRMQPQADQADRPIELGEARAPFSTAGDQQVGRIERIPWVRIPPGARTPLSAVAGPDYVLPAGYWWFGAYAGLGAVSGEWRGDDAGTLSSAEAWRSTAQGGLLAGREWHNGWSVSGGVGIARVRSTFSHEALGAAQEFTEVDTNWVENSIMDVSVYTWTIDSVVEVRTTAPIRSDARNHYTAVQVPLMVAWHGFARRVRYGAFGGVTAWIPTQRKGLALVQNGPDAGFGASDLSDARVNDRFGVQLHGQAGLSLGYSISEHLSAYAEPMISTPLFTFGDQNTPWLTRPLLQIRLQHVLTSKPR